MSRIDEMIAEFCPDGVEFARLKDIFTVLRGKRLTKSELNENAEYSVYHGGLKPLGKYPRYNREAETVMIINVGASAGSVGYSRDRFWSSDGCYSLSHSERMESRFAYYLLQTHQDFFVSQVRRAGIPTLDSDAIASIRIPVPPLEVQKEIVSILDNFIQLESELLAELNARLKQYEYYRNRLLAFDDSSTEVRWVTLGDVMTIVRGASPRPISSFITSEPEGVNWIKIGDVKPGAKYITSTKQKITQAGALKSRHLKPNDFVLSNSMSFGRPYILKIEGCIHDGWISMSKYEESLDPDFLYHLLNSDSVQKVWRQKASNGTVQNLNADIVRATKVPLPPKDEQRRIADLLDKFDIFVNDNSEGLPAEISARHQQYEYYRTKLLTFQELPS